MSIIPSIKRSGLSVKSLKQTDGKPDDCLLIVDSKGIIISVSKKLLSILGYEKKELIKKNISTILHPSEYNVLDEFTSNLTISNTIRLKSKRSNYQWFDIHLTKSNDSFLFTLFDISDKKKKEDSLFLFNQLINKADEAILVCDSSGSIVFSNQEAAEMYGLNKHDLLNLRIEDIDDYRNDEYKWERYIADLKVNTKITQELNFRSTEGKTFIVEERAHYSEINGIGYIVIFIRNISDRKIAENRIKKSIEQQKILSDISYLFTTSEDFEYKIREILRIIGNFTHSSRVFVFEDLLNGRAVSNTFEWCNRSEEPHKKNLQAIPYTLFPSWKELMHLNGKIDAVDINELPDDITKIFKPFAMRSLLAFPINIDSKYYGFLGFSESKKKRFWEEEEKEFLKILTNIISNAFEQKIAIDALKKSERRFREFAEMLPEIVCETNINGKITFANKLAFEKFGFTADLLNKGVVIFNLISEKDKVRFWENFENKIKGEQIDNEEYTIISRDGNPIPVISYINLIMRDHLPIGMRTVMFDITDRKKAEEQIISLAKIADESPTPILRVECNGTVSYSNKKGLILKDFVEQNYENYFKSLLEIIINTSKIEELEINVMGSYYSLILTPVQEFGYVNIYGRDITQKKNDEERLRNSEQRFRDVTDAAGEYIWETDEFLNLTYLSERVTQVLGYDKNELLNNPIFNIIHENERTLVQKKINFYIQNGESFSNLEYKVTTKNGNQIWQTISGIPIFDNQRKFKGFRGVGMDITQRKEYEEELNDAKLVAENASKIKAEFLSTMSHEIRTPMNAVIGLTHILLHENTSPEQLETLKILKFSAENLLVLLNDILDFSKIEAGKISFETIDFNLFELAQSIRFTFFPKAEEKGINLNIEFDRNIPACLSGDPVRLAQILNNLISNAVKFTETGSVSIIISLISIQTEHAVVKFEIIDSGIGIAKDQLERIFDSFTQASSDITRKFGGTGLGLAISKRLVEMQGGKLEVESELGRGSNFHFFLRYNMGNPDNVAQTDTLFSGLFESLKGINVLVVEDNPINQVVARKFLEKWDINFELAENGKLALERIQQSDFDLILMDIQMPIMDGYEATRQIRSLRDGKYKSLPIIALTASVMLDVQNKITSAGMDDFLIKPFNPSELYSKIKKFVKR